MPAQDPTLPPPPMIATFMLLVEVRDDFVCELLDKRLDVRSALRGGHRIERRDRRRAAALAAHLVPGIDFTEFRVLEVEAVVGKTHIPSSY